MTGNFLKIRPEEARLVEVRPQLPLADGTPDLEIRTPNQLVYVEVKSESNVRFDQLSLYQQLLQRSGFSSVLLVLLTRYPPTAAPQECKPLKCIRWHEVADWLEFDPHRHSFKPISAYLLNQFLGFLTARNMIMTQVSWELAGGVRALRSLIDMLEEAALACGLHTAVRSNKLFVGVKLNQEAYRIGIYYERPDVLVFETRKAKVDKDAANGLGVGAVFQGRDKSAHGWRREVDLNSEDVHFFSRTKVGQFRYVEDFLKHNLELVKSVEVP